MVKIWSRLRQAGIHALLPMGHTLYRISGGSMAQGMFSEFAAQSTVGTDVRIIRSTEEAVYLAKTNADGSISDRDFVILSTTDLHLEEDASSNRKTISRMTQHIADVKPDLVVFTGDVIQTDRQHIDSAQFAEMMEKLGIYWVYLFGNHETREERSFYKYFMLKNMQAYPHCLTKFGNETLYGYGNFAIHIMSGVDKLSQSLFFFDSGRDITEATRQKYGLPANMKGYDFLKPEQIRRYRGMTADIRAKYGAVRSMLYMHIPLCEYKEVYKETETGAYGPSGRCAIAYGSQYESVGCAPYNSGMFAAMQDCGGQAVFCGHDHVNDFCAVYEGIHLVYNQPSGCGTYTLDGHQGRQYDEKDLQLGVTLTTIHRDGTIHITRRLNRIYL